MRWNPAAFTQLALMPPESVGSPVMTLARLTLCETLSSVRAISLAVEVVIMSIILSLRWRSRRLGRLWNGAALVVQWVTKAERAGLQLRPVRAERMGRRAEHQHA